MNSLILVTLGIVALISFLFLLILSPKKTETFQLGENHKLDPTLSKIVQLFGGDITTFFPETLEKQSKDDKLERLIQSSSNPWNVTLQEFLVLRFVFAGGGLILGAVVGALASYFITIVEMPAPLMFLLLPAGIIGGGFLGFKYPEVVYENEKSSRDSEFKGNLPEAIDYLIMILSGGGYSLPVAFEMSLDYLPDGAVHDEFSKIVSDLHTGKTMESALNDFAERVPSEGIRAFSRALNNANKLSVSVVEILKARAEASRKELELEIEKRLAVLPVRIMLVLSPASAGAIMLIALAPSAHAIMQML